MLKSPNINNSLSTLSPATLNNLTSISNVNTISFRCLNDPDWTAIYIDDSCNELIECSSFELVSNKITFGQLIDKDESEILWDIVQNAVLNKSSYQACYHIKTPSNHIKTVFEQGKGVYRDNKLIELSGFMSDITPYSTINLSASIYHYFEDLSNELSELIKKKYGKDEPIFKLSTREIETLVFVCKGMTMKEIGHKLILSPRTVEMHINKIKSKLRCYTKSEIKDLFFKTDIGRKILMIV